MRLIDADRLKVMFEIEECPCALQAAILGIIDEQPTAYDPDKVVQQVVQQLEEFRPEMEQFGCGGMLTDIIDVVKAGGADAEY